MVIYDEKKMEQKPVYPTKQTPSYADWNLFKMGKELEESIGEGGVTKEYVDDADAALQEQIDGIVSSSDAKDIVGTYAELQAYDTSTLGNNDIIKVLQDSTHSGAQTYYRWVITEGVGAWVYIGQEGPYYTKSQADILLNNKASRLLNNISLSSSIGENGNVLIGLIGSNEIVASNVEIQQTYDYDSRGIFIGCFSVSSTEVAVGAFISTSGIPDELTVLFGAKINKTTKVIITLTKGQSITQHFSGEDFLFKIGNVLI